MNLLVPKPENTVAPWPTGEQRLLLTNISWESYEMIGEALRDRPAIRLTFDRGCLEIMTTSPPHEIYKKWLARLVEILAEEFNLAVCTAGQMTFKRARKERGLEGDDCFWIAHESQMRGKLTWDPALDPPPDLFLEIEISRSFLDRLAICAVLGIPEVWRFDGETIRVHILQANGTYREIDHSPTFPGIALSGMIPFLQPRTDMDYLAIQRSFRAWVQEQLQKKPTESKPRAKKKKST